MFCVNLSFILDKLAAFYFLQRERREVEKVLFNGSSVKCVDAFRIDLTEKPELFNKQKYCQDSQLSILLSPSNTATFFHFNTSKM